MTAAAVFNFHHDDPGLVGETIVAWSIQEGRAAGKEETAWHGMAWHGIKARRC